MQSKQQKERPSHFTFRVKMGEYEIEVNGTREEVLKTMDDLPRLVSNVHKAFENVRPKTVATLTVKTEATKQETKTQTQNYPKIAPTENCDRAILRLLETDWGKWRPRTIEELNSALKANGLNYTGRMLATVLVRLVKKGMIRRWNTDAGYVFILAEKETLGVKGETR